MDYNDLFKKLEKLDELSDYSVLLHKKWCEQIKTDLE